MINLALALAAGLVVLVAIALGTGFGWVGAVFPALVAAIAAYLVLARRTWKQLEAIFEAMQREVAAQKVEKAVQTLEAGFVLAPWQFLVASQLHGNIGILRYIVQQFDAAVPHLEKSFSRNWLARAMLACHKYRTKDLAGAIAVFEETVKANKKEGLVWAAYAWVLDKEGRAGDAVKVLGRAVAANPSDEKLKTAQQALQNDKKLKLGKLYGELWFQFHLERVPPELMGGAARSRRAIYRR